MADDPLSVAVAGIADGLIGPAGYALVRVHRLGGGDRPTLELMVERADGGPVGVDDCARISRDLAAVLDGADALPGAYTLQVSSPGIERPLTRPADFLRFAGAKARLELREPVAGRRRFTGLLAGIEGGAADDGGTVLLRPSADDGAAEAQDDGAPMRLAFAGLARARLVVDAGVPPRPKPGRGAGGPGAARAAKSTPRGRSPTARGEGSGDAVAGTHGRPDEAAGTR